MRWKGGADLRCCLVVVVVLEPWRSWSGIASCFVVFYAISLCRIKGREQALIGGVDINRRILVRYSLMEIGGMRCCNVGCAGDWNARVELRRDDDKVIWLIPQFPILVT